MIRTLRRARVPLVAAALAVALSACGTFSDNDAAAIVGDREVSRDSLEQLLDGLVQNSDITGITFDEATGSTPQGRQVLNVMVQREVIEQFLAENGESITDADREQVTGTIGEGDPFFGLPQDVQELILDSQAAPTALARIPAPDAAELERRYNDDPRDLGVLCVRHILSDTEAEADAVRAELVAGADFAELAASRSTDPTAADNGGAIEGSTGACMSSTEANQRLDPAFVAGASEARPGTFTAPIETSFGWHVVEAVPYADAAESLDALFGQSAGQLLLNGYFQSADVQIDPRYGVWSSADRSIQPLS